MKKVLLFLVGIILSLGLLVFFALQQWPQYWWLLEPQKTIRPVRFSPASPTAPARQSNDQYLLIEWDQEYVYYLDWVLPGVDPQDFSILGSFLTGNDLKDHLDQQNAQATKQIRQPPAQNDYQEINRRGYYLRSRSGLFLLNEAHEDEPPTLKRLTTNPN